MSVLLPNTRTAAEWRQQAAEARQRSADSFERSDTDGFLSQAASETMAQGYDLCATVVDNGGYSNFVGVYDLDGNLIPEFRLASTRYGVSFVRDGENGAEWFNPSKAKDFYRALASDRKKGYTVGVVRRKAVVDAVADSVFVRYVIREDYLAEPEAVEPVNTDWYHFDATSADD